MLAMFQQQHEVTTTGSPSSGSSSLLGFYCADTLDHEHPFAEPTEVLLSISMVPSVDPTTHAITFSPEEQSRQGFAEMVSAVKAEPNITKVTLLDTSYLQRHRITLRKLAEGKPESEAEEEAQKEAIKNSEIWQAQHKPQLEILNAQILDWYTFLVNGAQREAIKARIAIVSTVCNSNGKKSLPSSGKGKAINVKSFNRAMSGLVKIFLDKIPEDDPIRHLPPATIKRYLTKIAIEECVVRTFFLYPYEIYRGILNVAANMLYDYYGEEGRMRFVTTGNSREIAHRKAVDEKNKPQQIQRPQSSPSLEIQGHHKKSKSPPLEGTSANPSSFFNRERATSLPQTGRELERTQSLRPLQEDSVEIEYYGLHIRCLPVHVKSVIQSLAENISAFQSGKTSPQPSSPPTQFKPIFTTTTTTTTATASAEAPPTNIPVKII